MFYNEMEVNEGVGVAWEQGGQVLQVVNFISYQRQIFSEKKKSMQDNTSYQAMNDLVRRAEELSSFEFLQIFEEKYNLKEFKIGQTTPSYAAELYHDIFIKFMKNFAPNTELHWGENELRLFMWILALHLELKKERIDQLGEQDWTYFCTLFPNKQSILFQYQTLSLFKEPTPAKKWSAEEDEIFSALVKTKDGKYKWSELAKELYISSNRQFFRTPKQCRERWLNHLDPNKSKEEWDLREDFVLISHVFNKGKKWAQISKLLKNRRNEHSIKNRFKSLITREHKAHPEAKEESQLIQLIYRKYDNHFSKLRVNSLVSPSIIKEEAISTNQTLSSKDLLTNEVFQILKSKETEHAKSEPLIPSHVSIENPLSMNPETREKQASNSFLDLAIKQQREKQIRADMFLVEDPFEFLKKFFKSKDSYLWEI